MNEEDIRLLEENGWKVECESPFEIRTEDGSFASGEAAWIVLNHLRPGSNDPKELLQELDPLDKRYFAKFKILVTLIERSGTCFIIPKDMVGWCNFVGFETKLSTEDESSWWTCREKQLKNDSI